MKKQTSVSEKQYQNFDNAFKFNKNEEVRTKIKKNRAKPNLVYDNYFIFYKYHNIKEFTKGFPDLKLNGLKEFKDKLKLFYCDTDEIKPNSEDQKNDLEKRKVVVKTAFKLYNKLLNIYTTQYNKLSEDQKKMINVLNRPENLTLNFIEDNLPAMPPLKGDEEVKLEPEEPITERVKLNTRKKHEQDYKS